MSNDIRQYDVIAGRILNFPLEKSWIKNVRRVSNIFLRRNGISIENIASHSKQSNKPKKSWEEKIYESTDSERRNLV